MQRFADDDTRTKGKLSGREVQEIVDRNSRRMRIATSASRNVPNFRAQSARIRTRTSSRAAPNVLIAPDALLANKV